MTIVQHPPQLFRRLRSFLGFEATDRITAMIDQGIVSATNALTTIIVARACSKSELGLYAAGFSLIIIAFSVQKAVIITPYTVLSPRVEGDAYHSYRGSNLLHNLGLTVLLAVGLAAVGAVIILRGHDENGLLGCTLLTLAVAGSFIMFREFARLVAIADLDFWQALRVDLLAVLIQLSGLLALWVTGQLNARTAFIVGGVASGIAALVYLTSTWASYEVRLKEAFDDLKKNWRFGKWLFGSSFLRQISVSIYPWLIIQFHGAAEAGVWASCVAVVALGNPVMLALYNEAAPRIAHAASSGRTEDLRRAVAKTTRVCSLAALPFFVTFLIFGGRLVTLVYGPKYADNELTVALLATSSFVLAFGFAFPYGLIGLDRPRLDFLGNVASAVLLVTVGVWAAKTYGALGSALGMLLTHSVAVGIKGVSFRVVTSGEST